jgi:hypothetical protein
MTLNELLIGQFGVSGSDLRESVYTVGTTPVQVLPNDPNRVGFIISNLSTNTVYIALANAVTTTTGLAVGGGSAIASKWRDDFQTVGFARYMVSASSNCSIYVAEIVMYVNEQPGTLGGGS